MKRTKSRMNIKCLPYYFLYYDKTLLRVFYSFSSIKFWRDNLSEKNYNNLALSIKKVSNYKDKVNKPLISILLTKLKERKLYLEKKKEKTKKIDALIKIDWENPEEW